MIDALDNLISEFTRVMRDAVLHIEPPRTNPAAPLPF